MFWDKDKNYTKRTADEYNIWRAVFQYIICHIFYIIRLKVVYRLKVEGLENVPKDNEYIVCPNHLSTLDPPMLAGILPRRISFMAKKELFDIPFIRWWIDWMGTFAVNRDSLGPSTIKTVMEIKKSNWVFGIFPQGTRGIPGEITGINNGFAKLAKITKCAELCRADVHLFCNLNNSCAFVVAGREYVNDPFTGNGTLSAGDIFVDEAREQGISAL